MAANPLHAPILVGLGIEDLSMDPVSIPFVKEAIRSVSAQEMRDLVVEIMKMESAAEIDELVEERLRPRLRSMGMPAHQKEDAAKRRS